MMRRFAWWLGDLYWSALWRLEQARRWTKNEFEPVTSEAGPERAAVPPSHRPSFKGLLAREIVFWLVLLPIGAYVVVEIVLRITGAR